MDRDSFNSEIDNTKNQTYRILVRNLSSQKILNNKKGINKKLEKEIVLSQNIAIETIDNLYLRILQKIEENFIGKKVPEFSINFAEELINSII